MRIERTATFKKCYKSLKKKHYDVKKLIEPIEMIVAQDTENLIRKYRDHALKGNMKGQRELHIEKDWLLLYELEKDELGEEILILWLLETGSHDYIFRNY